jgi:hypothetical protein
MRAEVSHGAGCRSDVQGIARAHEDDYEIVQVGE